MAFHQLTICQHLQCIIGHHWHFISVLFAIFGILSMKYLLGITFRPVSDVSRRTSKSEKVHFFEFEKSRKSILEFEKSRKLIFLNSRNQENRLFHFREIPKKSTFWSSRNPKNCRFWKSRNPKKKTHTHKSAVRRCSPTAAAQMCSCTSVIFLTPERPQTVPGLLSSVGGTRDLSLRSRGGPSSDARSPYSPYSSVFAPSSDAWSP